METHPQPRARRSRRATGIDRAVDRPWLQREGSRAVRRPARLHAHHRAARWRWPRRPDPDAWSMNTLARLETGRTPRFDPVVEGRSVIRASLNTCHIWAEDGPHHQDHARLRRDPSGDPDAGAVARARVANAEEGGTRPRRQRNAARRSVIAATNASGSAFFVWRSPHHVPSRRCTGHRSGRCEHGRGHFLRRRERRQVGGHRRVVARLVVAELADRRSRHRMCARTPEPASSTDTPR